MEIEDYLIKYLPFVYEIRRRLLFLLTIFVIFGTLGFIYSKQVITFSLSFFQLRGVNIVLTSPFQTITLSFTAAFLVGAVVIFPLIIFQIISFLKPALHANEYKTILSLIPVSLTLFVFGFSFGIVIMRYAVSLFHTQSLELQLGNYLDISNLLSLVLVTSILMGIAFQFPVVLTILMRHGIVKYHTFKRQRIFAHTAAFLFAVLLPPTDILSTFLLYLPLGFLFELTLILNRWVLKAHLL